MRRRLPESAIYLIVIFIAAMAVFGVNSYNIRHKAPPKPAARPVSQLPKHPDKQLTVTEWGVTGTVPGRFADVAYSVPSTLKYDDKGESASFASKTFTDAFRATKCGPDCMSDPVPFVIIRSQDIPTQDGSGNPITPEQVSVALQNKSLIFIDGWYYRLPFSELSYGADDLPCVYNPTLAKGKPTCELIDAFHKDMVTFMTSLHPAQ